MEESTFRQPELAGRQEELGRLRSALDAACDGRGSVIFISGEAGIGKTRLFDELKSHAEARGALTIQACCLAENTEPLMPVRSALRGAGLIHLVSGQPPPFVVSAYLMNHAGLLMARTERKGVDLDADIFAGMLQAVENFVQDSLSAVTGEGRGRLGSLGYSDYTILLRNRQTLTLAVVIKGEKSEFLFGDMDCALADIADGLGGWEGDMAATEGAQSRIAWFVESGKYDGRFLADDPKIRQENLFDNILLGMQRQASERALVLFLDDLQWADPTTLNLMHYLARNTRQDRLLIIGTFRPEDLIRSWDGRTHQLETTMQNMTREDLLEKIELKRLNADDTCKVMRGLLGRADLDGGFLGTLHKETGGVPFYILEVLKLLAGDGCIARNEEGTWALRRSLDEVRMPSKVYDIIRRRLDRLDKGQRRILDCASIVGEVFQSDVVGGVTGLGKLALLEGLGEIESAHGLIHAYQGGFRFDHAKTREVLYRGIGEELRREYHRMVGDFIEERNRADPGKALNVLAHHYFEAGSDKAARYLVRAGDAAKERYSNAEATRLYMSALAVQKDDGGRMDIHERLGDVYFLVDEYADALEHFHCALSMQRDGRKKMGIHYKMAGVHNKMSDFQKSKEVCAEGLAISEEECIERAQLLSTQGWACMRMGDNEGASALLMEGLVIAERFKDQQVIASAHHSIGSVSLNKGDFDDALRHLETALEIRKEISDAKGQSATLNNIGIMYWNKGELDNALDYYGLSLDINKKMGHKWGISTAFNNIGLVYSEKGEMDKALEYYRLTLEIDERIGDKSGVASALNNIGIIHFRRGETDEAFEQHARALSIREDIGDKSGIAASHINLGNVLSAKGEAGKACEHFGRSLDIGLEMGDKWLLGHVYYSRAESFLALGDIQAALGSVEKGLELTSAIGARREEGMCRSVLGMIYREQGKFDMSSESFERAMAIIEELQDRNMLARVLYEYGLLWKARGEPERARDHLSRAQAMSREMGMRLWEERCLKATEGLN